jgi:hypothetical protein
MRVFHEPSVNWPPSKPETAWQARKDGQFQVTGLAQAAERVENQVSMFTKKGRNHVWRTTDLWIYAGGLLTKQGRFLNNQKASIDPRVVVEFDLDGKPYSIACDRYTSAAQNLCAIAAVIEGFRTNERHDVLTIHQLMQSVSALPATSSAKVRGWWEVLALPRNAPREDIETKYKELARVRHPDAGGNDQEWHELQEAIKTARQVTK